MTANSPLPFNIPLSIQRGGEQSAYTVTLKVTYKDSLRNTHELVTSGSAAIAQQQATASTTSTRSQQNERTSFLLIIIIGVAVAVAAAAAFIVLRRRKKARKLRASSNGPGERGNIEDILKKPATEDAAKSSK